MNIFYLDKSASQAAQYHCDPHVVKMCLETAQILSTVQRMYVDEETCNKNELYRSTHRNHPSVQWVQNSIRAYEWTYELFQALLAEYKFRYGRTHACASLSEALSEVPTGILMAEANRAPVLITNMNEVMRNGAEPEVGQGTKLVPKFRQPPCAMPKEFFRNHSNKPTDDYEQLSALHSYRTYYAQGKRRLLRYTRRPEPEWLDAYLGNDVPEAYYGETVSSF